MSNINFKGISKGIIFACLMTFLAMLLITSVSYFTDISMKIVDIIIFAGLGIGVFTGAYPVSKNAEEKSAVHGLLVGVGIVLIFMVCSFCINGRILFNSHLLSIVLLSIISGFLGGVLGR